LSNNWPLVTLASVLSLNRSGFWGEGTSQGDSTIPVRVIRNGDISADGRLRGHADRYFRPREAHASRLIPGDIALTTSGDVGKAWLVEEPDGLYATNFVRILRPDRAKVLPPFLRYALETAPVVEARRSNTVGTTIPNLQKGFYEGARVVLPPLDQQARIVAILDQAFAAVLIARANVERALVKSHEVFETHLRSLFTQNTGASPVQPLADLCDAGRGITYGVIKLGQETTGGVPCLRTSNVRWLRIETLEVKRIAPSLSAEYSRTILRGGEVLVNVRGTLGGVAVAPTEMTGWNVSREVAVVPVDAKRASPDFIAYLIASGASQDWLGGVKKGATYVGINLEDLRLLPVALPPMERQIEVVRHLRALAEQTDILGMIYEQKLSAVDELKQSLLHQAFAGSL
jgi:type I restriction enzyme S subunit